MDGWKDASTRLFSPPRYNRFCVIKSFGLPQYSTAVHFVFDNTLPHSANRLLILVLFPIRAHAFQSNRWYCWKIVLVALPRRMGCQSPVWSWAIILSAHRQEGELYQCLRDHNQYIITFMSLQWRYQGTVRPHRPAILEIRAWHAIFLT